MRSLFSRMPPYTDGRRSAEGQFNGWEVLWPIERDIAGKCVSGLMVAATVFGIAAMIAGSDWILRANVLAPDARLGQLSADAALRSSG
jgi:hypothetical protein